MFVFKIIIFTSDPTHTPSVYTEVLWFTNRSEMTQKTQKTERFTYSKYDVMTETIHWVKHRAAEWISVMTIWTIPSFKYKAAKQMSIITIKILWLKHWSSEWMNFCYDWKIHWLKH